MKEERKDKIEPPPKKIKVTQGRQKKEKKNTQEKYTKNYTKKVYKGKIQNKI